MALGSSMQGRCIIAQRSILGSMPTHLRRFWRASFRRDVDPSLTAAATVHLSLTRPIPASGHHPILGSSILVKTSFAELRKTSESDVVSQGSREASGVAPHGSRDVGNVAQRGSRAASDVAQHGSREAGDVVPHGSWEADVKRWDLRNYDRRPPRSMSQPQRQSPLPPQPHRHEPQLNDRIADKAVVG